MIRANMEQMYREITLAQERIRGKVCRTPLQESPYLSKGGRRIYMKLECFQRTRSFKIRGAMNRILALTESEKERGIAAVSSGNHGAAVSYCARMLGIERCHIFVPENTPMSKVDKIAYYGGRAVKIGEDYDHCHMRGMKIIEDGGMSYIDAYYRGPVVYAGQGTIGLEIMEDAPQVDTILVPVGGGGLLTGIGAAVKSIDKSIRVVGVQTEACPAFKASLKDGVHYGKYPTDESICEALVGGIGELAYSMAGEVVDEIITVSEESIHRALTHMILKEKIICEPSSAVVIAAVLEEREILGNNTAVVISGGNISEDVLRKHVV